MDYDIFNNTIVVFVVVVVPFSSSSSSVASFVSIKTWSRQKTYANEKLVGLYANVSSSISSTSSFSPSLHFKLHRRTVGLLAYILYCSDSNS